MKQTRDDAISLKADITVGYNKEMKTLFDAGVTIRVARHEP